MIRNYNGVVNRIVLRNLKKLCEVNSENYKTLLDAYEQYGKVSFYAKADPATGGPDKSSGIITLKSKTEIQEYLKKDFDEKLERYFHLLNLGNDYLLNSLFEYLKEHNGIFPGQDDMYQLEKEAEVKRSESFSSLFNTLTPVEIEQEVLRDILELATEIMESQRAKAPNKITTNRGHYPEYFKVETGEFHGNIIHVSNYNTEDFRDYRCALTIKDDTTFKNIVIRSSRYGIITYTAETWNGRELHLPITKRIITIHKGIVEMAKNEGIAFVNEVKDYKNVTIMS